MAERHAIILPPLSRGNCVIDLANGLFEGQVRERHSLIMLLYSGFVKLDTLRAKCFN